MSGAGDDEKLSILAELCDVFSGPYFALKELHTNNKCNYDRVDRKTRVDLRDILEYTANVLTKLQNGELDEAEDELEKLRTKTQSAACKSATVLPKRKLQVLKKKRLPTYWFYRLLLFSDIPKYSDHLHSVAEVEHILDNVQELEPHQWERCITKCKNDAHDVLEGLDERTPSRTRVVLRLFLLGGAILTIATVIFPGFG